MIYYFCICIVVGLLTYKVYLKFSIRRYVGEAKMNDKVVIVTGSNTGIGYSTAEELARRGAKVILACRNAQKAISAKDKIIKTTGNQNVIYKHLDFTSFRSVRNFASDIIKTEPKLDVLINNAGTGKLDNSLTVNKLPIEAQINHFSPFLLTMLLLPLLKSSAPSRIINVSSILHKLGTIENLNKQATGRLQHSRVYSNTKLANILFTIKLAEELKGTAVTVNCLHPGGVHSDMFRHQPIFVRLFLKLILLSPLEGAQCSIFLAVEPKMSTTSGTYFSNCLPVIPSTNARDKEAAEKLWKMSNDIVFGEKTS